jgi:hypothetical protein
MSTKELGKAKALISKKRGSPGKHRLYPFHLKGPIGAFEVERVYIPEIKSIGGPQSLDKGGADRVEFSSTTLIKVCSDQLKQSHFFAISSRLEL